MLRHCDGFAQKARADVQHDESRDNQRIATYCAFSGAGMKQNIVIEM